MLKSKLLKNIIIFTLSTILNKGLNFFVLPVLTFYLTKTDYGYLGFAMSIVTISTIYVGLWPGNFLMAKFAKYGKEMMAKYISNIFVITAVSFIAIYLFLLSMQNIIFLRFDDRIWIITIIMFYTLFMVIFNIFNTIVQLEKDAFKYAIFQAIYSISSLSLALLLIIKLHFGWEGRFYSEMLVLFLLSIYTIYYFRQNGFVKFDISKERLKELFFYLFPMTFYVVGIFALVTIDKVILARYVDMELVGIYTIAMTMAIVVNIIYDSIIHAWEPYFFEKIHDKTQQNQNWIVVSVVIYSFVIVFAMGVYILIVPYLFSIMIDEKFEKSLEFIPLLVVAFSLEGLRKPLSSFLMHKQKLKSLAVLSISGALLNIALNIYLIPKLGILGAVYATLFAFAYLYIVTLFLVFKVCEIGYKKVI